MTERMWSEVDLSAYLDGQLEPERRAALEADLATAAALRRRVEGLRQTVALLQAVPLREAPRNYLLTPSMVAEPQPEPRRARRPLWFMRVATALSAAAFVVTVGLQLGLVGGGLRSVPVLMVEETDIATQEVELQTVEKSVEGAELAEAPAAMPAPDERVESVEAAPVEPGISPAWDETGVPPGLGGMGSGEPERAVEERSALSETFEVEMEAVGETVLEDSAQDAEAVAETPAGQNGVEVAEPVSPEENPADEPAAPEIVELEEAPPAPVLAERRDSAGARWLVPLLGISTVLFAGITWWLARRR